MFIFGSEILQQTEFLSSQLGIVLQVTAVIAVLFSGAKYINKKLDDRINNNVQDKIAVIVKELCKQIDDLRLNDAKMHTAIEYIDKALMKVRIERDDSEIREMRGAC